MKQLHSKFHANLSKNNKEPGWSSIPSGRSYKFLYCGIVQICELRFYGGLAATYSFILGLKQACWTRNELSLLKKPLPSISASGDVGQHKTKMDDAALCRKCRSCTRLWVLTAASATTSSCQMTVDGNAEEKKRTTDRGVFTALTALRMRLLPYRSTMDMALRLSPSLLQLQTSPHLSFSCDSHKIDDSSP